MFWTCRFLIDNPSVPSRSVCCCTSLQVRTRSPSVGGLSYEKLCLQHVKPLGLASSPYCVSHPFSGLSWLTELATMFARGSAVSRLYGTFQVKLVVSSLGIVDSCSPSFACSGKQTLALPSVEQPRMTTGALDFVQNPFTYAVTSGRPYILVV